MSQKALSSELHSLICEIQSDKINARVKGLNRLDEIFNTRARDFKAVFDHDGDDDDDPDWMQLFECAFLGLTRHLERLSSQSNKSATENKNSIHSLVIQKIVRLANEDSVNIKYSRIFEKSFKVLENVFDRRYFGLCFLQIIEKNILLMDADLTEIKLEDWNRLLCVCFSLYKEDKIFPQIMICQCIYNTTRLGLKYSYVLEELHKYIKPIENSILELESGAVLTEWIKIAFIFSQNLAYNDHKAVHNFINNIFHQLTNAYRPHLAIELKEFIFEFGNLSLIIHCPDQKLENKIIQSHEKWRKMIKQFFSVACQEIKYLNGFNTKLIRNPEMNEVFLKFASRLCYFMFWDVELNQEIVENKNEDQESLKKRIKLSNKLQSFLDQILLSDDKFNWRWFIIFAEFLTKYPNSVMDFELKSILELAVNFQTTIQYPIQIIYLIKCVQFLIKRENELKNDEALIAELESLWSKLASSCYRSSIAHQSILEYHDLLSILILNKKYQSHQFIATALIDFSVKTFPKNSKTLKTLSSILTVMDIDLVENSRKIIEDCLQWLHSKIDILKVSLSSEKDEFHNEIYKIDVMLTLTRKGDLMLDKIGEINIDNSLNNIETNILIKNLDKLIINDINFDVVENMSVSKHLTKDLRSVINENMFETVIITLNLDKDFSCSDGAIDLNYLLKNVETILTMLNYFIQFGSLNDDSFDKSFLLKKLNILLQMIEKYFADNPSLKLDTQNCLKLFKSLNGLFAIEFHPKIGYLLRHYEFGDCFKWVIKQINYTVTDSQRPKLTNLNTLEGKILLRYTGFKLLGDYCCYDGVNSVQILEFLESEMEFNLQNNIDLNIVIYLIELFCKTEKSELKAKWILDQGKELCQFHVYHEISEKIIDMLPGIIKYVNDYPSLTEDILIMAYSFIRKCSQKIYSPDISRKIILTIKYLIQAYPLLLDLPTFQKILKLFVNFINSSITTIQFEVIKCLTYIFNQNWLLPKNLEKDLTKFYTNLFQSIPFEEIETSQSNTESVISVKIQFLTSIISVNYYLRKHCLFKLLETFYTNEQKEETISTILNLTCKFIDVEVSTLIENNFEYLLSKWLINDYLMAKFPWYLTESESQNMFFIDYKDVISFGILRYKCELLEEFAKIMSINVKELIKPILSLSIALLVPHFAECKSLTNKYKNNCISLETKILEVFTKNEIKQVFVDNTIQVIESILLNLNDEKLFNEIFEFEIKFFKEDYAIDQQIFKECLQYIQTNMLNDNVNIILRVCTKKPIEVVKMLNEIKLKLQSSTIVEEKLQYFLQYCFVHTYIEKFLKTTVTADNERTINTMNHIKEFLIRDFCCFVCSLMSCEDMKYLQLNVASCTYFKKFITVIIPDCSKYLNQFFSDIVSCLIPLTKHSIDIISTTTMNILNYLLKENQEHLEDSIILLDDFPKENLFKDFIQIHKKFKYKNNENHVLVNELETFLKIERCNAESVLGLKEKLENNKTELKVLYEKLKNIRGFSEDCENSILHRLVFKLLKLVQSNDVVKSVAASKCLGELGPSDLTTMILKSNHQVNMNKEVTSYDEAVENLCYASLEKLNSYLVHPDVRVLKTTFDACLHLAKTKTGQKYIDKFSFIQIFSYRTNQAIITDDIFNRHFVIKPISIEQFFVNEMQPHSVWIKNLTHDLFKTLGNNVLCDVCKMQVSYCERILPILIQTIMFTNNQIYKNIIRDMVNLFFKRHLKYAQENLLNVTNIYLNKKSIKIMLDVVECIRLYGQTTDGKIKLCYLEIARAALYCEAYFSTIFYCEIHSLESETIDGDTGNDKELHEFMRMAYTSLGDTDSATVFVDPINSRLAYLNLQNSWQNTFLNYDALSSTNQLEINLFKNKLLNSGFYYLARTIPQKSESDYEVYWRLADWDVSISSFSNSKPNINNEIINFEEQHYSALKCLNNRDELGMNNSLNLARKSIIDTIKVLSLECTKNAYKSFLRLQMIQQIEDFSVLQFQRSEDQCKNIVDKWHLQDLIPAHEFTYREPILSQRGSIYKACGIRAKRFWEKFVPAPLQTILLNVISEAREEGNLNVAARNLASLNELEISKSIKPKYILEDAQLQWKINEKHLAKKLLKYLTNKHECSVTLSTIVGLRLYGEYLAESQSENLIIIHKECFKAALTILQKFANHKDEFLSVNRDISPDEFDNFEINNKIEIYNAIAKYADKQYVQKNVYMNSPEFECKKNCVEKNVDLVKQIQPKIDSKVATNDERKIFNTLKKNIVIDIGEIKNAEKEKNDYLVLALNFYLQKCVLSSCLSDLSIFRVISLWFSNKRNEYVIKLIKNELSKIQSHKFLAVLPQLSARLTTVGTIEADPFATCIYEILEKCAKDHPHHTLYQLFAIANSYEDSPLRNNQLTTEPRVEAAKILIKKLKNNATISMIVCQMELMCPALIKLANVNVTQKSSIVNHLTKLKLLDAIQCPTVNLNVSVTKDYTNLTSIIKWDNNIETVCGINAPKKLMCLCSDGVTRPQLLKGQDDLRQDAVMQQVFTIMNTILKTNKQTSKRKLVVRTYKIVPLSQRSGILEWCENTIPLGIYLIGANRKQGGAHKKYRPNDMLASQCRLKMEECHQKTNEEKLRNFEEICSKIKPVLQYFLLELYHYPSVWFERRIAYVNSIATNSMIGYILGLGDRHVQNILLDKTTAEVIHIDFGIAFEQGKILPTPETVPFRLSRDIIAPMGVSGVDGLFRKSCEYTMEVLRQNQVTIITILEVLLFDPLYAWKLTNKKALSKQEMDDFEEGCNAYDNVEKNTTAERALMRLQEKLRGEEAGATGMSTVESQVERLIQQATNTTNLSRLFHGWQPYL